MGNVSIPTDSLGPETARWIKPDLCGEHPTQANFSKVTVICPGTEKEDLCVRGGEERGFTATEFKVAQVEG